MKTQMKFQKYLTLASLVFSALCIAFAFFFNSGMLYEIKFYSVKQYYVEGAKELYDYAQWANNVLVIMAIVLLLCTVVIYITATNTRRNYYVTNYIAIGLVALFALTCAVTFIVIMAKILMLCGGVDVAHWYELYITEEKLPGNRVHRPNPPHFSTNKATIIIGLILAVIMIAMAVIWVLNAIWKVKLMQGEKALLNKSANVSSEVMEVA